MTSVFHRESEPSSALMGKVTRESVSMLMISALDCSGNTRNSKLLLDTRVGCDVMADVTMAVPRMHGGSDDGRVKLDVSDHIARQHIPHNNLRVGETACRVKKFHCTPASQLRN